MNLTDIGIICFVGGLGSGKTLCLTWLTLLNYKARMSIYANYHLKHIAYEYVEPDLDENQTKRSSSNELIKMIDNIRNGFMSMDEFWSMLDSRMSYTKQNRFCSKVLLKSRKRKLRIGYTSQDFMQTEKRLRKITDAIGYPQYDKKRHICFLEIRNRYTDELLFNKRIYGKMIYPFYDTAEEVDYTGAY